MNANIVSQLYNSAKNILGYTPPTIPDPFVLDEDRPYDSAAINGPPSPTDISLQSLQELLRFAHRVKNYAEKLAASIREGDFTMENIMLELAALEKQFQQLQPVLISYSLAQDDPSSRKISTSIAENKQALTAIYRMPKNKDIIMRNIQIAATPPVKALAVFLDGMVDSQQLNLAVMQPLMLFHKERELYGKNLIEIIIQECLPTKQVRRGKTLGEIEEAVNNGDTALILDGNTESILIETKGWEHRGVNRPEIEQSVRGAQAAFSENLRVNTALIRSMLRSSDLVTEMIKIGARSRVTCAIMYIDSIANSSLVAELRRRVQGISTDYIGGSGELIQFIEDYPRVPFPQSLSTERPDRVAAHLAEGRVALIVEGNPFAQVLPMDFFSFFHSAEDFSLRASVSNFMRGIRLFGAAISVLLPSIYLAISYFHQEAIPTELLLAIAGSRENVPFPAWFEVLVMEISFELIREAGTRIPGLLGATIGIVGAIILGQAAVTAHIVSPIVVVVIALTGLASFTVPEYRMGQAIRITRFLMLLLSIFMGLVGLATGLLFITVLFCRMKLLGVPYLAPLAPKTVAGNDTVFRGPVFNQEMRPDALGPKDILRQPKISRLWKKTGGGDQT